MPDDAVQEGAVEQKHIGELVYQLNCPACGERIEVAVDVGDWPVGAIACPECGDESWQWDDQVTDSQ